MLTPAIHDRFVLNMDEQNLSENQTETTEQNFLHQRAFHRNRGLRDARYANPLRWGESKPGLLGLFHTSWKRNRGNPHFPRASERRPEGEVYVDIKSRLQINNGFGIRYAALAGAGIVMQRAELVAEDIAAGRLQALLSNYKTQSRPRHLVWQRHRRMPPKLRAFIDFIAEAYG
jgi:DNA-binding transcriptional LysR family regulator